MDMVIRHYQANALTVPGGIMATVEDQVCQSMPPGVCQHQLTRLPAGVDFPSLSFHNILSGTATLGEWLLPKMFGGRGGEKVSQSHADARGMTCVACQFNRPTGGCTTCNMSAIGNLLEKFIGNAKTIVDGDLKNCQICGCSLKVKVWTPIEPILKHLGQSKQQLPEWCWIKKESIA